MGAFSTRETMQNAAAANGNGVALNTAPFTWITFQVTGTFTATINPEATLDGSTWVAASVTPLGGGAAVTTMSAAGMWQMRCSALSLVRARVSGYASGSVTVLALASSEG